MFNQFWIGIGTEFLISQVVLNKPLLPFHYIFMQNGIHDCKIKYWSTLRTVEDTLHILLYQICSQDLILDSKIKGTLISLVCKLAFVFNGW